ncbi:hypothetical protein CAPTEDRAFT_204897 [Capitella teleta]|uniref:Uncharacterized protein n=1 Tax=Capitella teleta TaxID=283909 RepID=R7U9I8_CAPTE|nr:hypothetical protein CAPTEDRAFT_204897 [Capitella teleta]|eukprot:ELU00453.1 hypothetical protein CAPTEDRAFT_204897 [Capitella teleta]
MGTGSSVQNPEDILAKKRDKDITKEMERYKQVEEGTVKLLLIGAAESGKSTLAKQIRIIHQKGFDMAERQSYKHLIHTNVLDSICAILKAMVQIGIPLDQSNNRTSHLCVQNARTHARKPPGHAHDCRMELGNAINTLWNDKGVQEAYARASEFHIIDSTSYYLDAVSRLMKPDYIPTDQDILRARLPTTGIIETKFVFNGKPFRLMDVGGQRSERRKWIHVFDNVTAIIFTVSMSGYAEVLREDANTNQMKESLQLFRSICNHSSFKETAMLLFLNKKDIFQERIRKVPLKECFTKYTGDNTYEEASIYIKRRFIKENLTQKEVYTHFTNATDTANIQFVFDASMAVVLKMNLREAGIY